jgi:hypothetical protein
MLCGFRRDCTRRRAACPRQYRVRARCIDVAGVPAGGDQWSMRLKATDRRLEVVLGTRVITTIDTRSLSVLTPTQARPRPRRPGPAAARVQTMRGAVPIGALTLAAIAIVVIRRRLARRLTQESTR